MTCRQYREWIEDLVDGTIVPIRRAELERHLAECAECRSFLADMETMFVERAPLRRHIDADDVAAASAYLLSDDAKNVTGTTLYVDAGYHSMGM